MAAQQPQAAAAAAAATQQQPVLPWMRVPLNIAAGSGVPLSDVQGLHPALLVGVAQQLGFDELFPVQAAVWRGLAGGHSSRHDMCICAPTGSGKTLAYALPMLNAILTGCQPSSCHVLRGLVVLPTRSLAVQVHAVLHSLGAGAGISVALAAAQEGVAAEASKLAALPSRPGSGPHVLVATPGRLMAHLQGCSAGAGGTAAPWNVSSSSGGGVLSLQHLKFLVVDEADRLLRQDYHGWLPQVLEHIHTSRHSSSSSSARDTGTFSPSQPPSLLSLPPAPPQGGATPVLPQDSAAASGLGIPTTSSSSSRVVKLVVSATLTRDPSKLMRLQLCCPRFIALTDVHRRYALPPALQQFRLVVPAQHKPLALVGLLRGLGQGGARTVVFASSLDMTHRLYLLLAAVPGLPGAVAEYSSHVAPDAQAAALLGFKQGRVQTLVTSDAMARGMDVSGISCVVNYDPPTYPKTYIHRAGRTARAGSSGAVYSLLKPEDVVHFNSMVRKMAGSKVQQVKLAPAELQQHRLALKAALAQVQELVQLEQQQGKQQQQQQQQQGKRRQSLPQPPDEQPAAAGQAEEGHKSEGQLLNDGSRTHKQEKSKKQRVD